MRKDWFVRWCGAGMQVCLVVLGAGHAVAGDDGGGVRAVLEVALTEVDRSEGAQAFIASDDSGGELLVLLSDQASGGVGALDRVDPSTGEVERFPLALCDACPVPPRPLSRLAVTKGHVWVSTALARGPVYRVDRSQLHDGQRFQLVDELASVPPPDEPEEEVDRVEPEPPEEE
jgi:streptogramin lyase